MIIAEIICFFLAKRYEMSEKTDRGIELFYWKLSYRRKFIRTLWLIPVDIIVVIGIYMKSQSYIFTGIVGVVSVISIVIQAIYNYKKWKNGTE